MVETTLQRSEQKRYTLPIQGKGTMQYVVNNSSIPKVQSPPYLLQYTTPNSVYIPMHNTHHKAIIIEQGDSGSNQIQMKEDFQTTAQIQCNEGRPSFIDKDESMINEEKKKPLWIK